MTYWEQLKAEARAKGYEVGQEAGDRIILPATATRQYGWSLYQYDGADGVEVMPPQEANDRSLSLIKHTKSESDRAGRRKDTVTRKNLAEIEAMIEELQRLK